MTITLNLLSAEQKKKVRLQKMSSLAKQFMIALLAAVVLLTVIFVLAKITLRNSLAKASETYYKSNHTFNLRINQTNELLKFKDNLNKSTWFEPVDLPVQNLALKTNIDFVINAVLLAK